jgi:hypothetical protein
MPRGGRYRVIPTALWESTEFQQLAPTSRYLYVNLMTGSLSSFAGIGLLYLEALQRETGLAVAEIETALGQLEKLPTPESSWIVRDRGCVWVRRQLTSDPAIEKAGGTPSEDQQRGIITHLGSLPQDSLAVRKFRRFHKFARGTVRKRVNKTVPQTEGQTEGGSPIRTPAVTPDKEPTPAVTPDARARQEASTFAHASSIGQKMRREDAPAEWFNDCGEGRAKRCLKTQYLDHVDLPDQCVSHAKMRQAIAGSLQGKR